MAENRYYFDNMANTQPDPRVIDAMASALKETFGNPLNVHNYGQKTLETIERSRQSVADLISCDPKEIIFTSCGSESNNFAVKGIALANGKKGKHIITSSIEHFSVLYALKDLEKQGYTVTYVPVGRDGGVNPDDVLAAIRPDTVLVSITHASNEIGTIEPIKEIGSRVKGQGIAFHVDAVQTAGTIPVDVKDLGIDALTLSPNQFYGPTGIAALYLKKGTRIVPLIRGGTQEEGRRAGTQNISGIVGFGKACELAKLEMEERNKRFIPLRDKLLKSFSEKIPQYYVTGHISNRLPNHASGYAKYVEGESMSMFLNMEGIAVSTGSACASKALKASHVLLAIGINAEDVHGSLVFSLGREHNENDIDFLIEKLPPIVQRLREMSPLYKKGD